MGQETQGLLAANEHHLHEEEGYYETSHQHHNTQDAEHQKKHGIMCRILTRLHLKKQGSDHQKLLSESQEYLSAPEHQKSERKKEKKEKKRTKSRSDSRKEPKNSSFTQIKTENGGISSANRNNSNNTMFSTNYEMLENDLSYSFEKITELDIVDNAETKKVQSREHLDVHVSVIRNVHDYSDDHFGECSLNRRDDDNLLEEKPTIESRSTGQYLKHKWHGKRAKKARKRIRRAMQATWLSFQSGTNANHLIPSANTVATAFSPMNKR